MLFIRSILPQIVIFSMLLVASLSNNNDPYKLLDVPRHASAQMIRRSYKLMAKKWHPDKSNSENAEKKFVEIKQAYELLSDSERRRVYDIHGIIHEESHLFQRPYDYTRYRRFAPNPLEEFLGHNFGFKEGIGLYNKMSITTKYFERIILKKSTKTPCVLTFYNDWCFRCMRLVGAFKKMIDTLEPVGIIFGTVNAAHEQTLVQKLDVDEVPRTIVVFNGHCYVFQDNSFSVQKIIEFIRRRFPTNLIQNIQDDNEQLFLGGWVDNRVRAIFVQSHDQVRLRYLITAFAFRDRVKFGLVNLTSPKTKNIQEKYHVIANRDTLLMFNEILPSPVANLSISNISTNDLHSMIYTNQFLALPRLSSQEMLEGICPVEWNRPRKKLCIVLITENDDSHNEARSILRNVAMLSGYNSERVRFAYIFKKEQNDFVKAISHEILEDTLLRLVVIWRRDSSHIKYEWLAEMNLSFGFDGYRQNSVESFVVNNTKFKLDKIIHRLLRASESLSYEALIRDLYDEHSEGITEKMLIKFQQVKDSIFENVKQEHLLATFSLIGTIVFMLIVGYAMVYLVRIEEENLKIRDKFQIESHLKCEARACELKLHELRAEKYNGIVRLLKPGCRAIILIADLKTRSKLIPSFHRAVWPYRKTKALIFGHMLIEKGLIWFSDLLRLSLSESRDLRINPRNCIGTVIVMNGHRKYFCMYHAKHPENKRGAKRMFKITRQFIKSNSDPESGTVFDVENSEDSTTELFKPESKILLEKNLLDGLSNWLDRLFEGTTHRYYVNYWPDFPTK